MTVPEASPDEEAVATRALLAHLGAAMIATGQPVHEIQEDLTGLSRHLGHPGVQIGVGPTSITVALRSGAPATFELVTRPLRLDQASDVRRLLHQLRTDETSPERAARELAGLRARPTLYPAWLGHLAMVCVAAGIALILQPGWPNVLAAALCAGLVRGLMLVGRRSDLLMTLLPTVAAFTVTAAVFTAADLGLLEGPLRTVLPPLAVLLPGALMVTGMSELAAGHMQAGSARLTYGVVQLGLFALGLVAAVTLLAVPPAELANVRVDGVGWWAAPAGLLLIGVGICLMESVPLRSMPWILVVLVGAFAGQSLGQAVGEAGLGGFLGAIAATVGASLVEARRPSLARLVVFLPSFWLLVPGSLGLLGVSQLVSDPGQALQLGLGVVVVVSAIALGLLVGSAVARPLSDLVRRRPRTAVS